MFDGNESQLLAEVLASPDRDEPRLVYADWLEERADPRAELIRAQCEWAHVDRLSPQHYDYADQSAKLLQDHGDAWASHLSRCLTNCEYHRGFVHRATVTAKSLLAQPDALRSAPLDWVRITRIASYGDKLAAMPELTSVRGLDLCRLKMPTNDLRDLLKSRHFTSLTQLDLSGVQSDLDATIGETLGTSTLRESIESIELLHLTPEPGFTTALVASEGFPKLRDLKLGSEYQPFPYSGIGDTLVPQLNSLTLRGELTDDIVENLTKLPWRQLSSLDVCSTQITSAAVERLAEAGAFDNLRHLDVTNYNLELTSLQTILRQKRLGLCEKLRIANSRHLFEQGLMQTVADLLADHLPLQNLKHLELSHLRSGELSTLLECKHLGQLQSLTVSGASISPSEMAGLCAEPLASSLRELCLYGPQISDSALSHLGCLPNLLVLDLSVGTHRWDFPLQLSEPLFSEALHAGALPALRELRLDETRLTAKTMEAIAACPHLSELRKLSFCGNKTTDKAVHAVLRSEHLPKLIQVELKGTTGMKNRPKLRAEYGARIKV